MTAGRDIHLAEQLRRATARITELERMYRWALDSADIISALADMQTSINMGLDPAVVLGDARSHAKRLFPIETCGFLRVEESDSSFNLVDIDMPSNRSLLQLEIDRAIDQGVFGWAVQQNRTVVTPAVTVPSRTLLFHTVATRSTIWGMFVAMVAANEEDIADINQQLLSMILLNTANALESHRVHRLLTEYNRNLESAISQRTKELEQARQYAEAASEAKSAFLANVSHELRTPLNAVIGYSEILCEEMREDGATQWLGDLDKIAKSSKHLLGLIDDILDITKIESGRIDIRVEPFVLCDLLREVVGAMRPTAGERNNTIEFECTASDQPIYTDRLRLRQVLLNLTSNACQFTERGKITIRAQDMYRDGTRWLHIAVNDTGTGIGADRLATLYDIFSQAEKPTAKRAGGAGLGLAITKRLVQMLQGELSVESRVGHGSAFAIRLPVAAPANKGSPQDQHQALAD